MKVTKKNFLIIYSILTVLLISIGVGAEKIWNWHNQQQIKKLAQQISELPVDLNKQIDTNKYGIIECTYGCPRYYSYDLTGTHIPQTVIIVPTAMNHGAGKLLIVDKGKVIFESPELAQIYVKPDENTEENGFYLTYSNDIYTKTMKTDHYKYVDGNFVIVKSSSKDFTVVN